MPYKTMKDKGKETPYLMGKGISEIERDYKDILHKDKRRDSYANKGDYPTFKKERKKEKGLDNKREKIDFSEEPRILTIRKDYYAEVRLPLRSEEGEHEKNRLKVVVSNEKGEKYYSNFVNMDYVHEMLKEWAKTGENAKGSYFAGHGFIILKDLSEKTVQQTLEDLINSETLQFVTKKID